MRLDRTFLAAALFAFVAPLAAAQDYPAREIRSLCNFGAGSGADIVVRFYSDRLSKLAGKPVIVENKVGANGAIATDALAKSRPDGYTIMITPASSTIAAAPYLFKNLPFDTTKDFGAVTTIASLSFVIAVDAAGPIKSIDQLVAHLKSKPNHGFYGTSSNTGVIAAELFKVKAGLNTTYAPYKQNPQALTDLLLGQIDFLSYDATWAVGQGARLRILAATAAKRSVALPGVPTLTELGYGGSDVTPWWGVVVPAGTPRPVVDLLYNETIKVLKMPDVKERFAAIGVDVVGNTPDEFAAQIRAEVVKWAKVIKDANIKVE